MVTTTDTTARSQDDSPNRRRATAPTGGLESDTAATPSAGDDPMRTIHQLPTRTAPEPVTPLGDGPFMAGLAALQSAGISFTVVAGCGSTDCPACGTDAEMAVAA